MKVNVNWLALHLNGDAEKGNFQRYGSNKQNRENNPEMFLVKKKSNAVEDFSVLLINEFHGLKLQPDRPEAGAMKLSKNERTHLREKKRIVSNDDFMAVHFLNEYWA